MEWNLVPKYLVDPLILGGLFTTIWLSLASMAIGLVVGLIFSFMRLSKYRLISAIAWTYVWLFQGTPLLLQLIIIYTALPQLGLRFEVITCALLGLGLHEASFLAETFRGGIISVAKGQIEAARALGMRFPTMMRRIVLPQAARVILPEASFLAETFRGGIISVAKGQIEAARALGMRFPTMMRRIVLPQAARVILPDVGNRFNGLMKSTSLASAISMEELLRRTQ